MFFNLKYFCCCMFSIILIKYKLFWNKMGKNYISIGLIDIQRNFFRMCLFTVMVVNKKNHKYLSNLKMQIEVNFKICSFSCQPLFHQVFIQMRRAEGSRQQHSSDPIIHYLISQRELLCFNNLLRQQDARNISPVATVPPLIFA